MKVTTIDGEPNRYHVEGRTLSCTAPGCNHSWTPPKVFEEDDVNRRIGEACPRCAEQQKDGKLERRKYLFDVSVYNGCGECGCERFQFRVAPKLTRMSPEERVEAWMRGDAPECSHAPAVFMYHARQRLLVEAQDKRGGE